MNKGKWGGVRPGAGRKRSLRLEWRDAIDNIDVAGLVKKLEEYAEGKPVICSVCGNECGRLPDTLAIQAAIELLNRRLGKPTQRTELDITERIVLTSVQIEKIMQRYQLAQRLMLPAPVSEASHDVRQGDII